MKSEILLFIQYPENLVWTRFHFRLFYMIHILIVSCIFSGQKNRQSNICVKVLSKLSRCITAILYMVHVDYVGHLNSHIIQEIYFIYLYIQTW